MADDVVESTEEMKKKMKDLKKKRETRTTSSDDVKKAKTLNKKPLVKEKEPRIRTETTDTGIRIKKETPDTSTQVKEKEADVKEGLEDVKTQTKEGLEDVTTQAKTGLKTIKEETSTRTEQFRKESEKEGRNPAEKFLSDLITGFRQKTEDVNQEMAEKGMSPVNQPLTDVLETNESITIISDIPGLKKDDIEIGITTNTVEITTTYPEEPNLTDANFIQKERGYGSLHRVINLPSQIDVETATAAYKNCILTIDLPKKQMKLTKVSIQE